MAMQGSLKDMDVATLIQHNCQDRKTAQLDVTQNGTTATLFFQDGNVAHATLDELEGEEVIYRIINWAEGDFSLEIGIETPKVSIERSWSGLLLEAAKRMDEANLPEDDLFTEPPPEPEAVSESKKKSDILADTITELLKDSADIEGAAVVGTDGLIYAAKVSQSDLDENMVGAVSAAIFGLGSRSVKQLKRGTFNQIIIQGKDGYIIVVGLHEDMLFVGLTDTSVNLGMALAEVRELTTNIRSVL